MHFMNGLLSLSSGRGGLTFRALQTFLFVTLHAILRGKRRGHLCPQITSYYAITTSTAALFREMYNQRVEADLDLPLCTRVSLKRETIQRGFCLEVECLWLPSNTGWWIIENTDGEERSLAKFFRIGDLSTTQQLEKDWHGSRRETNLIIQLL